jgi:hypothetical protein
MYFQIVTQTAIEDSNNFPFVPISAHEGAMVKGATENQRPTTDTTSEAPATPEVAISEATKREHSVEADFFSTLISHHREHARSFIEIFEAATDLVAAIDTLLVRHAEKFGFDRNEDFNRFGDSLFKDVTDQVTSAAERLASRYFLENERTKHEAKYTAVVTSTRDFIALMREAQEEEKVPHTLLARDAFKLVAQNITAISLQDRGSDVTTIVELDAQHLVEHELRGCMQLADALIEQGGDLSAKDKLLLHQSAVYHRVGLMIPPVLEAIAQKGVPGSELGIPMLAAHYVRTQYDDPSSVWQTIFSADEFELIHRAVLYHDKKPQSPSDMALQVTPSSAAPTREHNIEAIVRIAHKAEE